MSFFDKIKKVIIYKEPEEGNTFVLAEKPVSSDDESSDKDIVNGMNYKNALISPDMKVNRKIIENIFSFPENGDFIISEFDVHIGIPHKFTVVFMNSLIDKVTLHTVIEPLMQYDGKCDNQIDIVDYIMKKIVPANLLAKVQGYGQVIDAILVGKTAIFIENSAQALLADTIGWKTRSVEQPISEKTVKGPQEAFNENFITNISLIRRILLNHNLVNEIIYIGTEQKNTCSVMYLKNTANSSLVKEVKRRLSSIKSDFIPDGSGLEQFIEDHPFMALPQVINTERPDRVVSSLLEGRVAIVLNNSPNVIIVPVTFWSLMYSQEDKYLRFEFATILRFLRYFALMITLFMPALYIAITNFHQEMIPTDLLFAIAGAREKVPFPTIVEVLIMETSFELIREAGLRIPGLIGPTLGIIGALILGQAAVAANIVSPILIIIVALTGIGSFAIPDYSLAFGARVARFMYILLASFLGLYGIAFGVFVALAFLSNMKSFGVPYLAPIAPLTKSVKDAITRFPLWNEDRTPDYLNTKRSIRQPKVSRGWVKSKPEGRRE